MKKIIGIAIILLIIAIECFTIYKMKEEADIKKYEAKKLQTIQENTANNIEDKEEPEVLQYLDLILEEYKGYKVSAKLNIEKLNINTYVLEECTKASMQVAQAKLFGPNPNEVRKLLYRWA